MARLSHSRQRFCQNPRSQVYIHMMKKELSKCGVIVVDTSCAITIALWENQIEQVFVDRSFWFQGLKVNCFNKKQLNSTKCTKIDTCDDIAVSPESSGAAEKLKLRERAKNPSLDTFFLLLLGNLLFASWGSLMEAWFKCHLLLLSNHTTWVAWT